MDFVRDQSPRPSVTSSMSEGQQLSFSTDMIEMSFDPDPSLNDFLCSYGHGPFPTIPVLESQESVVTPPLPKRSQDYFVFQEAAAPAAAAAEVRPTAAPPTRRKLTRREPSDEHRKQNAERSKKNRQKEKLKRVELEELSKKLQEDNSDLTKKVEDLEQQLMESEKWRQHVHTFFHQGIALIEGGGRPEPEGSLTTIHTLAL